MPWDGFWGWIKGWRGGSSWESSGRFWGRFTVGLGWGLGLVGSGWVLGFFSLGLVELEWLRVGLFRARAD